MTEDPPRCESCEEIVHIAVLYRHPDDGAAVLCELCAAAWEAED